MCRVREKKDTQMTKNNKNYHVVMQFRQKVFEESYDMNEEATFLLWVARKSTGSHKDKFKFSAWKFPNLAQASFEVVI